MIRHVETLVELVVAVVQRAVGSRFFVSAQLRIDIAAPWTPVQQ